MPCLSSDLFNQMSLYDPTFYFSGEDKVSYPEIVPDEIFYGSSLSHLEKEGFDLESGALDYHLNGDDQLSHNQDEQTISENDYFNYFWGENWLFTLKDSSDWSHVGELEKPETPQPDDEVQAIWKSYSYNHDNVELSYNFNYEFPRGDGSKNVSLWKNCYECFDDVPSGNDELYGFITDESLSEWLGGFSSGYEEAVVATDSGSQEP